MTDTTGTASAVVPACLATGNYVVGTGNVFADVLGADGVFSLVEQDGFMVNGSLMAPSFMGKMRGTVGTDGHPIFVRALDGSYALAGERVTPHPLFGGRLARADLELDHEADVLAVLLTDDDFKEAVHSILFSPPTFLQQKLGKASCCSGESALSSAGISKWTSDFVGHLQIAQAIFTRWSS